MKAESKPWCQEHTQENQGEEPQVSRAISRHLKDYQKEAPGSCSPGAFHISTMSPNPRSPGCPVLSQPVKVSGLLTYPREGQGESGAHLVASGLLP